MKKYIIAIFLFIFVLLFNTTSFAQTPGDFGDSEDTNPTDAPAAPINDYILPMLLVGVYMGYRLTKRKTTQEV